MTQAQTPAQQVRAEIAEARRITRVSWSEKEVLACLDRVETVVLLALGIRPTNAKVNTP
jgi:hypothetical protein